MRIIFFQKNQLSELAIILFFQQFSILISAGIPIIRSCDVLIQSQPDAAMQNLLQRLKYHLLSGKTFHSYLISQPQYFSNLICHLIRISEYTGRLDTMLALIATHLENLRLFKKQIHRALFYPGVIALTGIITTISMLMFIVPRFAELFQHTEQIPFLTRLIFSTSTYLNQHIMSFLLFLLLPLITLSHPPTASTIKQYASKKFSTFPFIQTCVKQLAYARFARNLSMTLNAGVNINDALQLSAAAINNSSLSNSISIIIRKIHAGLCLHDAMGNLFPTFMTQLIEVGEESGKLTVMLDKIADVYESDANHLITRLTQLLEPLIMILLGVLIGGMVICIYLPVFNLGNTF